MRSSGWGATGRPHPPRAGGNLITVQASRDLVKELGDRLYETIGLDGEAIWDPESWEVTEFRAVRVLPYRPGDIMAAFRELATVSANAWDGVDAEEYVRQPAKFDVAVLATAIACGAPELLTNDTHVVDLANNRIKVVLVRDVPLPAPTLPFPDGGESTSSG